MTTKKCSNCAMSIPEQAKICPYCRKKLGWTTGAKVGLGVIVFFIFMAWIESFHFKKPSQKNSTLTTDQHLLEARKSLETNYRPNNDPIKTNWGKVKEAEEHLKAIETYNNEQQKNDSDRLMKEIERRKNEIEKAEKKFTFTSSGGQYIKGYCKIIGDGNLYSIIFEPFMESTDENLYSAVLWCLDNIFTNYRGTIFLEDADIMYGGEKGNFIYWQLQDGKRLVVFPYKDEKTGKIFSFIISVQ